MARGSIVGIQHTLRAAVDLSAAAKQYTFVKLSAAQTGTTCVAAEAALGVQQNRPKAGSALLIRQNGTTKLLVDGTTPIAANARLTSDASGRGVVATGTQICNAIAMDAATVANVIIEAQIISPAPLT